MQILEMVAACDARAFGNSLASLWSLAFPMRPRLALRRSFFSAPLILSIPSLTEL
jgi:hypothetical protein